MTMIECMRGKMKLSRGLGLYRIIDRNYDVIYPLDIFSRLKEYKSLQN